MTTSTTSTLTPVGEKVQAFYEANPFPAFDITKYRTRDDVRERASPYVKLLEDNVLELSLPSDSYDYVFCNGVLHHTGEAKRGFSHVARIVKPGGYLTVGLYNAYGRCVHGRIRWLSLHLGPIGQSVADWGIR